LDVDRHRKTGYHRERPLIAESPELATPPDALQVTSEPDDGGQTPMASGVLIWTAR